MPDRDASREYQCALYMCIGTINLTSCGPHIVDWLQATLSLQQNILRYSSLFSSRRLLRPQAVVLDPLRGVVEGSGGQSAPTIQDTFVFTRPTPEVRWSRAGGTAASVRPVETRDRTPRKTALHRHSWRPRSRRGSQCCHRRPRRALWRRREAGGPDRTPAPLDRRRAGRQGHREPDGEAACEIVVRAESSSLPTERSVCRNQARRRLPGQYRRTPWRYGAAHPVRLDAQGSGPTPGNRKKKPPGHVASRAAR